MAQEFQTEKVLNLAWEQRKTLTIGVLGHSRDTTTDAESSFREGGSGTFFFGGFGVFFLVYFFLFCSLDTGLDTSVSFPYLSLPF